MLKKFWLILLFGMMAAVAKSQTTTLSATVTDSQGVNWINAPYTIKWGGQGTPSTTSGQSFTLSFSGTTNNLGQLSQVVTDVAYIVPANSFWNLCVTSAVSSPQTYCTPVPATGSTYSATSLINSVIIPPSLTGGPLAQAYADSEVTAVGGNEYFRITDATFRCYTTSWGGCVGSSQSVSHNPTQQITGNWFLSDWSKDQTAGDYGATGRIQFIPTGSVSTLWMASSNIYGSTNGEGNFQNPTYETATIETPNQTSPLQVTWQGSTVLSMAATAGVTLSDPIGVSLNAMTPNVWMRVYDGTAAPPTTSVTNSGTGTCISTDTYKYEVSTCLNTPSGPNCGTPAASVTCTSAGLDDCVLTMTAPASIAANQTIWKYGIWRTAANGSTFGFYDWSYPPASTGATTYTDSCTGTPNTTYGVPATQSMLWRRNVLSVANEAGNTPSNGAGNGADITNAVGTTNFTAIYPSTNAGAGTAGPAFMVGNCTGCTSAILWGGSNQAGIGHGQFLNRQTGEAKRLTVWFDAAIQAYNAALAAASAQTGYIGSFNTGISGSQLAPIAGQLGPARLRWAAEQYAQYVFGGDCVNDFGSGSLTWQECANLVLAVANTVQSQGKRFIQYTLSPRANSTDNFATIANETPQASISATILNMNTWTRAGDHTNFGTLTASQSGTVLTVTGNPTQTLGANTCLVPNPGVLVLSCITSDGSGSGGAGTYNMAVSQTLASGTYSSEQFATSGGTSQIGPLSPVYAYYDKSAAIETNCTTGLPQVGGQCWPVPSSLVGSTLYTATGTPTNTSLSFTPSVSALHLVGGQIVVVVSSGTVAVGSTMMISDNTSTSNATLYANNSVPWTGSGTVTAPTATLAAGDTFYIIPTYSPDGFHESLQTDQAIASGTLCPSAIPSCGAQTFVANTIKPF